MSGNLSLRVIPPNGEPFEHVLGGDNVVVGRSSDCDVSIPDRFLSRRHLRFVKRGQDWEVEDLGSRNGTILNRQKISKAQAVRAGDQISASSSSILVFEPGDAVPRDSATTDLGHTVFRPASDLIESVSGSAAATESADDLRRHTQRLQLLNEVHRALGTTIELGLLLDLILKSAFEHLGPEEAVIYLKDVDGKYQRAAFRSAETRQSSFFYSETLINEVGEKGLAALVLDAQSDERFESSKSLLASGVRSLVAAPFLDSEGSLGMIALSSHLHRRQFNEEDMEVLVSLASVAALRIRNLALAAEASERKQLEQELTLARQIQVALLPKELPEIEGYEILGRSTPSRGVSGDFYEIVEREGKGDCVLLLADISGKGMAASLLTASLEALAAGPIQEGCNVDEILGRVNQLLYERTPASKYATAFVAALEPRAGALRYANGGHNAALLVRESGEVERLESTGTPVGLLPAASYQHREISMKAGDLLVVYTDGITEAENPEREEYGIERLAEFCLERHAEPLDGLATQLEESVAAFVQSDSFADDCTFVLARRKTT